MAFYVFMRYSEEIFNLKCINFRKQTIMQVLFMILLLILLDKFLKRSCATLLNTIFKPSLNEWNVYYYVLREQQIQTTKGWAST